MLYTYNIHTQLNMHNRQWASAQHIYGSYRFLLCIMYLAATNKRYENLVSNLAWDCINLWAGKESVDFTTEFPTKKLTCDSVLLIVDDKLKRGIKSQLVIYAYYI